MITVQCNIANVGMKQFSEAFGKMAQQEQGTANPTTGSATVGNTTCNVLQVNDEWPLHDIWARVGDYQNPPY